MGFFQRKPSASSLSINHPQASLELSDSQEENYDENRKNKQRRLRRGGIFKKLAPHNRPNFRKLNESSQKGCNSYVPPSGFQCFSSPEVKSQEPTSFCTLSNKKAIRCELLKSSLTSRCSEEEEATDSNVYVPPPDFLHKPEAPTMNFEHSVSGSGEQPPEEFRQFVFDKEFKKIERVSIERSDVGNDDFMELIRRVREKPGDGDDDDDCFPEAKVTEVVATPAARTMCSLNPPSIALEEERASVQPPSETKNQRYSIATEATVPSADVASVVSQNDVVSVANATVIAPTSVDAEEEETLFSKTKLQPFHIFATSDDPFIGDGWLNDDATGKSCDPWGQATVDFFSGEDPFAISQTPTLPQNSHCAKESDREPVLSHSTSLEDSNTSNEDHLIQSIRKSMSSSSNRSHASSSSSKPDPPQRQPNSSAQETVEKDALTSTSSAFPSDSDTVIMTPTNQSKKSSSSSLASHKTPSGIPDSAILGSMAFHDENVATLQSSSWGSSGPNFHHYFGLTEDENKEVDEETPAYLLGSGIPALIKATPSRDLGDCASSVTEEASTFYNDVWGSQRAAQKVVNALRVHRSDPNQYRADSHQQQQQMSKHRQQHHVHSHLYENMFSP